MAQMGFLVDSIVAIVSMPITILFNIMNNYEKRKTIVKTDRAIYSVPYAMYKLHGAVMPKLG